LEGEDNENDEDNDVGEDERERRRGGMEWKRKKGRVWYGKKKESGVHTIPLHYTLHTTYYCTLHTIHTTHYTPDVSKSSIDFFIFSSSDIPQIASNSLSCTAAATSNLLDCIGIFKNEKYQIQ
jgi:hypothetical protein